MKRFLFSLALLGIMAFSASPASADYIYNVSFSDPNLYSSGNVSVTGTITIDKLGALAASDVTGYSLTVTSPDAPSTILDPTTSDLLLFGSASLTADALALTVSLPA